MTHQKLRILNVVGTRPEAIKMAPIIVELQNRPDSFIVQTCVTAQHREMLDQALALFDVKPDYDLDIMQSGQSLVDVITRALQGLQPVFDEAQPDIVIVQGDTTTTYVASLAASMRQCGVAHVEAGLRTYQKHSPFPEELNRRMTSVLADWHFPPTEQSRDNLLQENVPADSILVTGNTVIDALLMTAEKPCDWSQPPFDALDKNKRLILVTAHRRESFGEPFENICKALAQIAATHEDVELLYPVHPNPNVQEPVNRILRGLPRLHLIEPLDYARFVHLMKHAHIILTDSGGIQEEAPALGKPVLVMRDTTERPEGVEAGTVKLVGTETDAIVSQVDLLLGNQDEYERMSKAANPYGDGHASGRIADFLIEKGRTIG